MPYLAAAAEQAHTEGIPMMRPMIVELPDDPTAAEIYGIKIYPNPASKEINLQLDNTLLQQYSWKLIDQRGVTVLQGGLNRDLREPQQIDISGIANGIYFMAIQTSDRSILYKKIAVLNNH